MILLQSQISSPKKEEPVLSMWMQKLNEKFSFGTHFSDKKTSKYVWDNLDM